MAAARIKTLSDICSFQMVACLYFKSVKTIGEKVWLQYAIVPMLAGFGFLMIALFVLVLLVEAILILELINFAKFQLFWNNSFSLNQLQAGCFLVPCFSFLASFLLC